MSHRMNVNASEKADGITSQPFSPKRQRARRFSRCIVQTLSTADGALFCVSGRRRVNTSNNGVFYSVDSGVEPHYYLPKPSMFYDREKLTEYINGLMW